MKKLLVVFNGINYSSGLSSFSIQLARMTGALIHAVFVSPALIAPVQYPFPNDLPLTAEEFAGKEELEQENEMLTAANMQVFKDSCEEAGINFSVNLDTNVSVEAITDHSAFSDLILCDAIEHVGSIALRDVLTDTHCPVLLVPASPVIPERAVLCYDESFSSIYAIKMYSYLFPEWKDLPTHVLTINPKGDNGLKYEDYLSDWLPGHFSSLEQDVPQGNLQRELISFIRKTDQPTIVVMGAYGRNAIARLFHRSLANIVIEETNALVFIMHE